MKEDRRARRAVRVMRTKLLGMHTRWTLAAWEPAIERRKRDWAAAAPWGRRSGRLP